MFYLPVCCFGFEGCHLGKFRLSVITEMRDIIWICRSEMLQFSIVQKPLQKSTWTNQTSLFTRGLSFPEKQPISSDSDKKWLHFSFLGAVLTLSRQWLQWEKHTTCMSSFSFQKGLIARPGGNSRSRSQRTAPNKSLNEARLNPVRISLYIYFYPHLIKLQQYRLWQCYRLTMVSGFGTLLSQWIIDLVRSISFQ